MCSPIRVDAATVTWVAGSGDWDTATNWSTGTLPGPSDDVVIGFGPAITVTHSTGLDAVNSILSQQVFVVSGGSLAVSNTIQVNNAFTLSGGTIAGANILQGTNGAGLIVNSDEKNELDGVTVNGDLDLREGNGGAAFVMLTNGLVLNGTAWLGNATNGNYGQLVFQGTQTLSGNGTVVLGSSTANNLFAAFAGTTLTIGTGITVRGQNGQVGTFNQCINCPQVGLVNLGTISADVAGGAIFVDAQPFTNQGTLLETNGGTLALLGNWSNSGTLAVGNGTLNLGGNFTTAGLGTLSNTGGSIILSGTLDNTASTLLLDAGTGSWVIGSQVVNTTFSGTIRGGTVLTTNGASLIVQNGTLDGVTVNGDLDLRNGPGGSAIAILTNGLVLNGTAWLGNATNGNYGQLVFQGTQTLSGNGTVVLGSSTANNLFAAFAGTTLTIGTGITVRGQNGQVGTFNQCINCPQVGLVNLGTISADVAGGAIFVDAQPFTNQGTLLETNGGTLALLGNWSNSGTLAVGKGTLNLGGNFTTAGLGTLSNTGGSIILSGTLDNTASTLLLDAGTGSWVIGSQVVNTTFSGTIRGGTVLTTNGTSLIVQSGTLDGVTLNGDLDLREANGGGAFITVTNGLVLNGTAWLGNALNGTNYGVLSFQGTQMLSGKGNVVLGYSACNGLTLVNGGTILTLGPAITVHGQNGQIGLLENCVSGPVNVAVVNQGTISADVAGGTITISAQPFSNQGVVESPAGTLNLAGSISGLGNFLSGSGVLQLSGILANRGTSLVLSGSTNVLTLQSGTISGGTVVTTNGASLIVQAGSLGATLDGVTLNGDLDLTQGNGGVANVTVTNNLVLNGTAWVGNATNFNYGWLSFAGTQSLLGKGTVVLGDSENNNVRLTQGNTTLSLGPDIVVHGQNGQVGLASQNQCFNCQVGLVNLGTISADVAGGTIVVDAQPFSNEGTIEAVSGGTLQIPQNSTVQRNVAAVFMDGQNSLNSQPSSTNQIAGSLLGDTKNIREFTPLGTTVFNGSGTVSSPQQLEVMGQDLGASDAGFINNFNYGTLELANGTYVQLVNQYQHWSGTTANALYANSLVVPAGTTLNLNGLHVYARESQIGGVITNGTVTQVPNSGTIGFSEPTLGHIASPGQLDQWTFFGRAGQFYTVVIDPGGDIGASPNLGFVQASVVSSNGVVIASNTNATSGSTVVLSGVTITNDGTYSVQVHAGAISPGSTGYYMVTIWETTPNVMPLTLGQPVGGNILTPYSVDQWTFGSVSNTQVRFDLINSSGPGVAFDLIGPNGWAGFTNISGNSGFITLPTSGNYSVIAHSLNEEYGASYAFELLPTAITNLTLGTQYQGQFAVTGQAELFQFNVPAGNPLQIMLNNLVSSNHAVIYAGFGQLPTPSTHNFSAAASAGPNQQLLIPLATVGTWYVLVYGDNIQLPGGYTFTASSSSLFLSSATPNSSGLSSPTSIMLTGSGFDASSSVEFLDSSNNVFQASAFSVDSFTQITITEAAGALPPGAYSIRASLSSGASGMLSNSFLVLSTGAANFTSSLVVPSDLRPLVPSTIYPQYANTGSAQMLAPLLVLTLQQNGLIYATLTTDPSQIPQGLYGAGSAPSSSHSCQFLASGQTPGLLQPGENLTVPVYFTAQQATLAAHSLMQWNLAVMKADDPTPIHWALLEASMQPSTIPDDAWGAIWMVFTNQVGTTWGNYVTMLDNNASYLGRLGLNVVDVNKLLAFQFMLADGLTPMRTLASSVDASLVAPGLPLTFSRSFGEPISQRYALGPFGRGWSHNWQYSLQQATNGIVTIFGPAGSLRVFQSDARGGYFAQPGDYGTLAPRGNGGYILTEKTGLLYSYNANGHLSYVQDLNNNTITLGYTGPLLTGLTHSSGQYIQMAYNAAGLIQTVTDNFGHQTILTYDAANQHLLGAQYFDGRTANYTYNTTGSPAQVHALTVASSSCCNWRYFNYDSLGRLTGSYLGGNADALTLSYGMGGQVTLTDALNDNSQFYYDNRGILLKTADANGNCVQMSFDNNYNLVSFTDPEGRSYNYGYDSEGNVTSITDPLGNNSKFSFTSFYGRLASLKDAKGNTTGYAYDSSGNLASTTYADGSVEDWTYDSFGDIQTWTNRRGHQTQYTFNKNGQITGKLFANGSGASYAYDTHGNLTNASTFDSNLTPLELSSMKYDASNRLTRITYPGGNFLSFTYESSGRRTSSVDQLGHQLSYFYDIDGRLQSMTNELNTLVVEYQYDPAGRVATKTVGNGMFTTHQYDSAGQLLSMTNAFPNGSVFSSFACAYDRRGRRLTMSSLDGQWTYAYDDIGQLTQAIFKSVATNITGQDLAYLYDSVGNRVETIENSVTNDYSPNNLNECISAGTTRDMFDADGNLIDAVSTNGVTEYSYNDENRLITISSPQGNWQFTYDAFGNRTVSIFNGTTTRHVIDPVGFGNIVGEYDTGGNLLQRYDYSFDLLSRADSDGNVAFFSFDAIGNVQQLVLSSGTIANSYFYAPFGRSLVALETIQNPFQFGGEFGVASASADLKFMRARFFNDNIGAFVSVDPTRLSSGDINFYRYGFNAPTRFVDPSGLDCNNNTAPPNLWQRLSSNPLFTFQSTVLILRFLPFLASEAAAIGLASNADTYNGVNAIVHNHPMGYTPDIQQYLPPPGDAGGN